MSCGETIIVVTGLPRSGTSMMMGMLEAGGLEILTDRARVPDEDNPRGYYEFEPTKELDRDAGWLWRARGKVIKVAAPLLHDLPPAERYRLLWMRRDLDEVLTSQQLMLARQTQHRSRADCELKDVYLKFIEDSERWISDRSNMQTLYVNYKAVISEPAKSIATISAFLRVQLDTLAMERAVDRKLYRTKVEHPSSS